MGAGERKKISSGKRRKVSHLRGGNRKGHGGSMAALPRNAPFLLAQRPKPRRNVGRATRSVTLAGAPKRFQTHGEQHLSCVRRMKTRLLQPHKNHPGKMTVETGAPQPHIAPDPISPQTCFTMSMPSHEPNLLMSSTIVASSLGYPGPAPGAGSLFRRISEEEQDGPASPHVLEEEALHHPAAGPMATFALCRGQPRHRPLFTF